MASSGERCHAVSIGTGRSRREPVQSTVEQKLFRPIAMDHCGWVRQPGREQNLPFEGVKLQWVSPDLQDRNLRVLGGEQGTAPSALDLGFTRFFTGLGDLKRATQETVRPSYPLDPSGPWFQS